MDILYSKYKGEVDPPPLTTVSNGFSTHNDASVVQLIFINFAAARPLARIARALHVRCSAVPALLGCAPW